MPFDPPSCQKPHKKTAVNSETVHDCQFLQISTHETKASEVQDRVNDAYLKANDQKEGIQSYGMLTTLMLMHYYDNSSGY